MLDQIHQRLETTSLPLDDWAILLENGWDRVGTSFFQRRYDFFERITPDLRLVQFVAQLMPLRYRLDDTFQFSKSQKAIQRKNADLRKVVRKARLSQEKRNLFANWYAARFNRSNEIEQWVSGKNTPFPTMEIAFYDKKKLVACSFFDQTTTGDYSTIAIYDPKEAHRSLGTYTLIAEIEYALENNIPYHYPGHAYYESSKYDYKKRFHNLEAFDWNTKTWVAVERLVL